MRGREDRDKVSRTNAQSLTKATGGLRVVVTCSIQRPKLYHLAPMIEAPHAPDTQESSRDPSHISVRDLTTLHPACFDASNPRPLKIGIHKDLIARHGLPSDFPAKASKGERKASKQRQRLRYKAALAEYCNQRPYLERLVPGAERIDLDGRPAGTVTAQEAEAAAGMLRGDIPLRKDKPLSGAPRPDLPIDAPLKEDNIVPGRLELTVKFNHLPQPMPVKAGMKIGIETEGALVVTTLPQKSWKKLLKAANEWPEWVASVTGKLGAQAGADGGAIIVLEQPAVQVFEKKARPAPAETA
jgi:hypothetical protein